MRVCAIVKYPPIQGGVSAQSYWLCRALAEAGHDVHVVTNAEEVEEDYRLALTADDRGWLEPAFAGGRVRVHRTEPISQAFTHVPQSNPFAGKLAGLATEVVREHGCEVIFSYYLEPYGVAAHLCSSWTGVPYVVRNAGSDLGRLMHRGGLGTAYREVFRRADGVCASNPYPMIGLGVRPDRLYPGPRPSLVSKCFHPGVEPLDLNAHLAEVARSHPALVPNQRPLDPALPVIGVYGKMGVAKGSFDLLAALGALRREGLRFNFVALTRGRKMSIYLKAIEDQGLADVTWVLPFVAHWKVGRFLRACRAVCFLERDFPIAFHTPTVPREVLASGTCLILSGEIAAKQALRDRLVSGENVLIVPDPRVCADLAAALRQAIEDPVGAEAIGRRGAALLAGAEELDLGAAYGRLLADVIARRRGEPSAFSAAERGLAANRGEALRRMTPALIKVLGGGAEAAVEAFLEARPAAPAGPFEDAADFCRWVEAARGGADPALADAARFTGLLVWMGGILPEEEARPPFDRPDLGEARRASGGPGAVGGLAPLCTRWLRVERFSALPPSLGSPSEAPPGPDPGGEVIYAFHKRQNANGHHFRINAWTAELLRRCDGARTLEALIDEHRGRSARPAEEVRRAVTEAIVRLHREGIVALVDPAPGRSG